MLWANSSVSRIGGAAARPTSLLAVTVDLTLRRQAEQSLREVNERRRAG